MTKTRCRACLNQPLASEFRSSFVPLSRHTRCRGLGISSSASLAEPEAPADTRSRSNVFPSAAPLTVDDALRLQPFP